MNGNTTGWISFFTIVTASIFLALLVCRYRKVAFVDGLVAGFASWLSFAFDMIFCKELLAYHYVTIKYAGLNSFIAGMTIFPAITIIFFSFIPKTKNKLILYILAWSVGLTIFELAVVPLKAVVYPKWRIIPWSLLLYLIVFPILITYRNFLIKHIKTSD